MKQRTGIFSTIYMWVGILSLVVQVLGTGRIIKGIGVGPALAILPLVFVAGFTGLMFTSALFAIAAFQACQRASNFGIANVAREALWPVVSREEKFKAKNIVDGAVFRGADFVNAFIYTGLAKLFSVQPVIAGIGVVLAGGWAALSFGLGRMQEKRATRRRATRGAERPRRHRAVAAVRARRARRCCAGGTKAVLAESCTGGYVAKLLTDVPGSSQWFDFGLVTYSNEAKQRCLGVSAETLLEHGAVSEPTVLEMAAGALSLGERALRGGHQWRGRSRWRHDAASGGRCVVRAGAAAGGRGGRSAWLSTGISAGSAMKSAGRPRFGCD